MYTFASLAAESFETFVCFQNKPSETFVETQAVNQFKAIDRQMPPTLHLTFLPNTSLTTQGFPPQQSGLE